MNLSQKLNYHYNAFDKSKISPDPLQFLHLYKDKRDIEVVGFLASVFAYGNVKQIVNSLKRIQSIVNEKPYDYIINFSSNNHKDFKGFVHRFYTEDDIINLFLALNSIYKNFGSLKNLFLTYYLPDERNLKNSISQFSNYFIKTVLEQTNQNKVSRGVQFMFPKPEKGSACKRMNLFLRWMVRKDELDFGLWNEIPTSKLIIPVDTHIAKMCKSLKLTKRKNVNWKMAEEITENLKKFDAIDPVKYDFALCHIGMRKLKF
ncbi:MAG: TIGR02757 family protein [Ignavibacteria bacterium RIFOXYB2_FULL_35_12]|nr:MAG: TIGR02757 family protein [Ignavibacteria bacterium GWA2_36_19]OGU59680.1 MAG: TIGR02757 family protein [Ignavibacteria bacterium GWF2_35_20]OGU82825.1 MAG: TIGR02757 family protein [Ignavibacteria bacterium RIFOXYA2_FULL_35_9]OGU85148.1 MAG: TIGR02757 family protein [Ignavibacteria bacterium RIFOXYA12_FULL_35_25]OGU91841.1 MAG: TIGR02757 family protein [Ignavibacteria bacterium RIFOXYC12_FULL_35_11]OGU97498.1 MAG: TIGR02757 family protein [Ignavibacteria bacterium RIFOXYB12_FULL_35_14]